MNIFTNRILAFAALLLAIAASTPSSRANTLVDGGFEVNPLDTASNVLNNFPVYQGIWGVEAATITGVDGAVTPYQGNLMLRMVDDGQTWTQAFQVTDVTSYAALIDSGSVTFGLSAYYNADLPAALGGIYMSFFTANTYSSLTGTVGNTLALDSTPTTWEPLGVGGAVPVGTRWLVSQVAYNDASLLSSAGATYPAYVDAANLDIKGVPEPGALSLLALGGLALIRRRR